MDSGTSEYVLRSWGTIFQAATECEHTASAWMGNSGCSDKFKVAVYS